MGLFVGLSIAAILISVIVSLGCCLADVTNERNTARQQAADHLKARDDCIIFTEQADKRRKTAEDTLDEIFVHLQEMQRLLSEARRIQ